MNRKSKIIFKEWIFIVTGWIFIMYLYNLVTIWGMRHMLHDNALTVYFDSGYPHLEIFLQGTVFGTLFAFINTLTDRTEIRKKSFGAVILIRSGLYLLAWCVVGAVTYAVFFGFGLVTTELVEESLSFLTPIYVISWILVFVLSIIFMNFVQQVSRKFGQGNLLKLMLGKYHKPKDEEHIFMFMDLRGSTAIAERLGHNKYSQLMQNCFYDLTDIVLNYKASIYQYVGDEVVLTWETSQGINDLNCIKAYFAFEQKIKSREEFYVKNFSTKPFFKCGIDVGEVTVAEIGDIKREIAYHGDVLNTAARIEKLCTPQEKKMLISEYLEKELPEEMNGFSKEFIGNFELRGKEEGVKIYSITYDND
jgi:adenylate cyclase